jgi:cytochrome P450 family 114
MTALSRPDELATVPDVPARLADADNLPDPYPYLDWVREHHPVHQAPGGYYLAARHADNVRVYGPEFRRPDPDEMAAMWPRAARYRTLEMLSLQVGMQNPPEHTRLRKFFSHTFNPHQVNRMRSKVTSICEELLDAVEEPLRDGEVVDLHTAVSVILPTHTIAMLIDISEPERDRLYGLLPRVNAGFAPSAAEETMLGADQATDEITDFFAGLIAERRKHPGDDYLSACAAAQGDEGLLSEQQVMSIVWGLISGGTSTTTSGLSSGMLMMARNQDTTGWLRGDDPARARAFATEVIRHECPSVIGSMPYFAIHEMELSGVVLAAGAEVHAMPAAANRDPSVFPDPDRFDPARETGKSLGFGHGTHYCLGTHLAMMQMTTMFTMLHRRFPGLVLADTPVWGSWLPLRCLSRLPCSAGQGRLP